MFRRSVAPATLECHRLDHAEINRRYSVRMIAQKCSPGLRWRPTVPDHVLGDRRLGDLEAKLEQFTVDAGHAPQSVLLAYLPYEFAQLPTNVGNRASGNIRFVY